LSPVAGRKALVVITDGCDASQTTVQDLSQQIAHVPQLILSVVDFGNAATDRWNPACPKISKTLSAMAASTSGVYASIPLTDVSLDTALQTISYTLRHQYVVTYAEDAREGSHPPEIEVVDNTGRPSTAGGTAVTVVVATHTVVEVTGRKGSTPETATLGTAPAGGSLDSDIAAGQAAVNRTREALQSQLANTNGATQPGATGAARGHIGITFGTITAAAPAQPDFLKAAPSFKALSPGDLQNRPEFASTM
jgi:hypothetical protein